jgi:hypothetical protein
MPTADLDRIVSHRRFEAGAVHAAKGRLENVALITGGVEALGHGSFIDETTVRELAAQLVGRSLPAYIGHDGPGLFGDGERLTSEVGIWSGIHLADGKLRAKQFQFLRSFEEHEPAKCARLMELAEKMPDQFGISLVGQVALAWATPDGDERFMSYSSRPDNALHDLPSVRFSTVESADFVKCPAANPEGLFAAQPPSIDAPAKAMATEQAVAPVESTPAPVALADNSAKVIESLKSDLSAQHDAFATKQAEFDSKYAALTAERDALAAKVEGADAKLASELKIWSLEKAALVEELALAKDLSATKLGVPAIETVAATSTEEPVNVANFWQRYKALPAEQAREFYRQHISIARRA